MAGSMWSSDGSGVGKNSSGGRDEMVMLYAMSSLSVQSLPDLADRMKLAIVTSKSEGMVRTCAPPKTPRDLRGKSRRLSKVSGEVIYRNTGHLYWSFEGRLKATARPPEHCSDRDDSDVTCSGP